MKQFFRFFSLLLLAAMTTASAYAERQKPVITNYPVTSWVTDHGYYIYNVGTDKWLSNGEAWGTQSCVVDFENDASGKKPFTYQIKNDVQESTTLPEGTYYFWSADVGKNRGWMARINTDGTSGSTSTCFSDGNAGHFTALKVNWVITDMGGGVFQITVPVDDPNGMYMEGCALGVDPEHYSKAATPTYALYWDIPADKAGCQWMFYDAEAFNAANEIYSVAAPALKEAIEKADAKGIDVTAAQAVYDNDNATLEEINAQIKALNDALIKYATAKDPVDVTEKYITNPSPVLNGDGWTMPKGAADFGEGASNGVAEFWNKSGYSIEQTIHLPAGLYKLTAIALSREGHHGYLSAGDYKVELAHVANSVVNSRAQAKTWFNEGNGVNELFFPMAAEGDITIALTTDTDNGDHWTVWREFKLDYLGNDLEKSYKDAIRMTVSENWADEFATDVTYTQSYFDAVGEAIASVDDIASVDEAVAELANPAPAAAIQNLRDNVAAWDAFSVWYDNMQTKFYSDPIAEGLQPLGNYVNLYDDATDMEDWLLDVAAVWDAYAKALAPVNEEITTEMLTTNGTEWFDSLYRATVLKILSQEILPHTDITKGFLANPDYFSDGGTFAGWTVATGKNKYGRDNGTPTWFNKDTGKYPTLHRVMERWNGDFNIYQDIVLPKTGAYRVSTWGFYRTSDNQTMGATNSAWAVWNAAEGKNEGANTICAFFYADQLQKAFPNICNRTYTRAEIDAIGADYDDETASVGTSRGDLANVYPYDFLLVEGTDDAADASSLYIPNGVYSADYVFTHNPYQESYKIEFAFVGQENQPLRLGIKAENVGVPAGDIGWTLFDQLQLIYEGGDAEILAEPLDAFIDQANGLVVKPMDADAKTALTTAISDGTTAAAAADGNAMLKAYIDLDKAIAAANTSIEAYEKLVKAQTTLAEAIAEFSATASDDAVSEANGLKATLDAGIADGTIALENVQETVDDVATAVAKLQIPDFDKKAYPYDLTFAIKNPKFTEDLVDGKVPGWQYNESEDYAALSVANGIAEGYVGGQVDEASGERVASKKGFQIWQTIETLPDGRPFPAGVYEIHAQGVARLCANDSNVALGFADPDANVRQEALNAHLDQIAQFYANGVQTTICNLYELPASKDEKDLLSNNLDISDWYQISFVDDVDENTGEPRVYYIANNRSQLAQRFAHSRYNDDGEVDAELTKKSPWYDNTIKFAVAEDGKITFGWGTDNAAPDTWAPMTNFRLFMIAGTDDPSYEEMLTGISIQENNVAGSAVKAIYSIDGRQVNGLQRGINIVKTNGAVKKVIVK